VDPKPSKKKKKAFELRDGFPLQQLFQVRDYGGRKRNMIKALLINSLA